MKYGTHQKSPALDSRVHIYLGTLPRSIPCTLSRCQTVGPFIRPGGKR